MKAIFLKLKTVSKDSTVQGSQSGPALQVQFLSDSIAIKMSG